MSFILSPIKKKKEERYRVIVMLLITLSPQERLNDV